MKAKTPSEVQAAKIIHILGFHTHMEARSRGKMTMGQADKVGTATTARKCSTSKRSGPIKGSRNHHISAKSRTPEGPTLHLPAWVVSLGIL